MRKTATMIMVAGLIASTFLFALDTPSIVAAPTVRRVPQDYNSIQAAVNAADPNDTVFVSEGTYHEHITIGKSLSLIGQNATTTIIEWNHTDYVVQVIASSFVTISGFTIRNGSSGIAVLDSTEITITNNNITKNKEVGIWLSGINSSVIGANTITSNNLTGIALGDAYNNMIAGNKLYFNRNQSIGVVWSSNNTIYGNQMNSSENGIILMGFSMNNTIVGNTVSNSSRGVYIKSLGQLPSNNTFYHNYFTNNQKQVTFENSTFNKWDNGYPSGGNYWSDYTGVDANGDGIGDTPYIIDSNNTDRYPLMILLDVTMPITLNNYDRQWRITNFFINLTATDDMSGVAATYYRINDGPTKNTTFDGQPHITIEGADNKLEYWSVDKANNEEIPHQTLTNIKLDKTDPLISILTPQNNSVTSSNATALWFGSDRVSGIGYYEARLDAGLWINTNTNTSKTFTDLSEGEHTIYVRATDYAGRSNTTLVRFTVRAEAEGKFYYPTEVVAVVVLGAIVAGLLYFYTKKRKRSPSRHRTKNRTHIKH